jgi:hypothetical protein
MYPSDTPAFSSSGAEMLAPTSTPWVSRHHSSAAVDGSRHKIQGEETDREPMERTALSVWWLCGEVEGISVMSLSNYVH